MKIRSFALITALAVGLLSGKSRAADIVDTAVGAGNFKTLAAALGAADLVETLKGDGPFTVFAPTDAAFSNLPDGTVQTLLKPENKDKLSGILTYHVVPGKVLAEQVVELPGAKTVNGQRVDIQVKDGKVMIDNATVEATDIVCDNGVIHVIDSVILPSDKTIPEVATSAGNFKTLLAAAKAAGLVDALSGDGPLTVFAPTDDAFAKIPEATLASLLKPENKQQLVDILTYHVVSGRVYSEDALKAKSAKTLGGSAISIGVKDGVAMVNNSKLVATDIDASNGVIHVIDTVLMPPMKGADARKMLEQTVAEGSRLFNAGHHQACASRYEHAMKTMMTSNIGSKMKHEVKQVMKTAKHQTCPTERSWTLRHGIDRLYAQLNVSHH